MVDSRAPLVLTKRALTSEEADDDIPVVSELADFDAVYREHAKFLWSILRRLGVPEHDVGDALQEVFLVAYRRRDSFEGAAPLRSWLYGIALRVARSYNRKATFRRVLFFPIRDSDTEADDDSGYEEVARKEALAVVDSLLERLPRKQREVFVLAEIEEMTAQQIATVLGCNVNTVYSRLRLARQRFEAGAAQHHARESSGRSAR